MEHVAVDKVRIDRFLWPAAGLSLAAGIVHLIVSPAYLQQWWGYGFFFIWAGMIQIAYALAIFLQPWMYDSSGPSDSVPRRVMRGVYLLGAAGNAAVVTLYIITRTAGIPFVGPGAGTVEPVTPLSVATTAAELVLVGILLGLARQAVKPETL